ERQVEKYVRSGLTREEAARRARIEFGGMEQVREDCREARGVGLLYQLLQDTRYALRIFARSPGFTSVAVLTLALGIGANTAVFSVINAAMLRALPVREPEQLVQVVFSGRRDNTSFVGESFSVPLFRELEHSNQLFAGMAALDSWDAIETRAADEGATTPGEPMKGQFVSASFFATLGIQPVLGRAFLPEEDTGDGAHPLAVISYATWEHGYARDPNVLGRKLTARGVPLTIIGVAPRNFSGVNPGKSFDLWIPMTMGVKVMGREPALLTEFSYNWLSLIGRLKPGVSREQAAERLDTLFQALQRQQDTSAWSKAEQREFLTHRMYLVPAAQGTDYLRKEYGRPLTVLMSMVALVLLIACANAANLQLARASTRRREIAVRTALGARGWRLLRQLLTESVMLAIAAAVLGMLLAYWGSRALVAMMSITLDVHPDPRVLVFTTLVALLTGIGSGLAPAIGAARKDQSKALRAGPASAMDTRTGSRLGRALTAGQIALSLVVVFCATLLVRTLRNLETLDPGFNRRNVLLFHLDPGKSEATGPELVPLFERLMERLNAAPGVRSASYSFITPISGGGWDNHTWMEGYTPSDGENVDIYLNGVGPNYFETLGTPLLAGRSFGPNDTRGSGMKTVINQTMARRYFAGRNPIGRHIGKWPWAEKKEFEIVGVVGDAKYTSLREEVPPTAYLYVPQLDPGPTQGVNVEVRSSLSLASLTSEVRETVKRFDSQLLATDFKTLEQQVDESLEVERLMCTVSTGFAVLALLLACIGLYGVISYSVARRTNEIGLRMALGAERSDVFRMVIGQGLLLAVVGLAIGAACAMMLARVLTSASEMLYGVRASDPATLVGVSLALAFTAVLACLVPALRAMSIDPMTALRYE
ncbi:MAG TPA: ABC transporter permease, partial [Terracidiphilus sp.]|nr:ABC transporter permease [Terracidiphilus sp.]